jgi:hypothetical protein
MRAALGDQVFGVSPLGVHGGRGDRRPGQVANYLDHRRPGLCRHPAVGSSESLLPNDPWCLLRRSASLAPSPSSAQSSSSDTCSFLSRTDRAAVPPAMPFGGYRIQFHHLSRGNSSPETPPRKGTTSSSVSAETPEYRWYCLDVPKSPILPLAAAVTALALGAAPAQAATLSPGKRDQAKVVAFPLFALKGQAPESIGAHVSHSSHVSGSGGGHLSHVSHASHVSSVPGLAPVPTSAAPATYQAPPPAAVTTSPSPVPAARSSTAGSPTVAPQGSLTASPTASPVGSSAILASGSPTSSSSSGGGCAFVIFAPFGVLMRGIRWLTRRGKAR